MQSTTEPSTWGGDGTGQYWYVAGDGASTTEVQFTGCVTVQGDVRLILADNATLTASKGITVATGNSLTIYAQSEEDYMGRLIANAGNSGNDVGKNAAGIGGGWRGDGGTVTINGGMVTAEGKGGGKGIGSGDKGQDDGDVILNETISVLARNNEDNAKLVPATEFEQRHDQAWAQTAVLIGLAIDPSAAALTVGETQKLTATFDPEDAAYQTVKWSVGGADASAVTLYSDASCNTPVELDKVTKTSTVYAKGESAGKATVTVTSVANPNKSASCNVAVKATLTFDLEGGTLNGDAGPITKEAEVGSTAKLLEAPTKDGHTFKCWKDTYGNGYVAGATYAVTADQSFTAEWTENGQPAPGSMSVTYAGHVQRIGDVPVVKDGATIGSVGQSKRLEQFVANVSGVEGASISYRAHLQGEGWGTWVKGGEKCGSTGKSRRIEAVQMTLSGADGFHVWYRVHCQDYGWLGWARDGSAAGTTGLSLRAEAVEINVLPAGQYPIGYNASKAAFISG